MAGLQEAFQLLGKGAAFQRKRQIATTTPSLPPPSLNFFARAAPAAATVAKPPGADADAATGSRKRRRARSGSGASQEAGSSNGAHTAAATAGSEESEEDGDDEAPRLFSTSTARKEAALRPEKRRAKAHQVHAEEMAHFRNRMGIHVDGGDVPDAMQTFGDLDLPDDGSMKQALLQNIEQSAWKEPTPIQMQAVPALLAGRDVLASAPTGSGKTAAFVLPVLATLRAPKKGGPRAVLLAPTRELAAQIHRDVLALSKGKKLRCCLVTKAVCAAAAAAAASGDPAQSPLRAADIVVSTPMRLVAAVRAAAAAGGSGAKAVPLRRVQVVVLDEADKLFDVGREDRPAENAFVAQVDEVLAACGDAAAGGTRCQRALFSATVGPKERELANSVLRDPIRITIGKEHAGAPDIDQKLVFVGTEEGKLLAIRQMAAAGLRPPVLIFLQSKERAQELFRELVYDGMNVDAIHADRTPEQRDRVVRRFRAGEIWVLLCTDLMARGIDFKGVNTVVNYDLPQSAVSYIHRIGRTGRAGRRGEAVTLFTEEDMGSLRPIANVVRLSGCQVPEWMLQLKQVGSKDRKRLGMSAPHRRSVSTVSAYDRKKAAHRRQVVQQHKQKHARPAATTGQRQQRQQEEQGDED